MPAVFPFNFSEHIPRILTKRHQQSTQTLHASTCLPRALPLPVLINVVLVLLAVLDSAGHFVLSCNKAGKRVTQWTNAQHLHDRNLIDWLLRDNRPAALRWPQVGTF